MTDLAQIRVGAMVWSKGVNDYRDGQEGGMVVRVEPSADGETQVVVLMDDRPKAKPFRPSLIVHHLDGRKGMKRPAYEDIGFVARLARMAATDIDPTASDGFRHHDAVLRHARMALFAAAVALLPDYFNPHLHDEMVTAYRVLRAEAELLRRGVS